MEVFDQLVAGRRPHRLRFDREGDGLRHLGPADARAARGRAVSEDAGRWLAYQSNESGRFEIYVQSFPTPGAKYQVTTTGAQGTGWSRDGRELFVATSDGALASVPVSGGEGLQFGAPVKLFNAASLNGLDVTEGGRRFLTILPVNAAEAPSLTVVLNWTSGIRPQARTRGSTSR
jgi:hypothetical protein